MNLLDHCCCCIVHVITEQSIATSVPSTTTFSSPSMTSSLPTSTVSADSEASDGLPTGAIVGIAVGVVLALGAVLIIIGLVVSLTYCSYLAIIMES